MLGCKCSKINRPVTCSLQSNDFVMDYERSIKCNLVYEYILLHADRHKSQSLVKALKLFELKHLVFTS